MQGHPARPARQRFGRELDVETRALGGFRDKLHTLERVARFAVWLEQKLKTACPEKHLGKTAL